MFEATRGGFSQRKPQPLRSEECELIQRCEIAPLLRLPNDRTVDAGQLQRVKRDVFIFGRASASGQSETLLIVVCAAALGIEKLL